MLYALKYDLLCKTLIKKSLTDALRQIPRTFPNIFTSD